MFTMEIDFTDIEQLQTDLKHIEQDRVQNLVQEASIAQVLIKNRISKGKTVDGRMMESKSKEKTGKYSKSWAKMRAKKGRQTNVVDLEYTGTTKGKFRRINGREAFREDAYDIGFDEDEAENIALYNNEMFGEAYGISDAEADETFIHYLKAFREELVRP